MIKKLFLSTLIILLGQLASLAQNQPAHNILILHSYQASFPWNQEIDEGINHTLASELEGYTTIVEYMDSKRIFDTIHQEKLFRLYQHKFRNLTFDVIITSDDDALQFLKNYGEELFPSVPVVFCGINNYHPDLKNTHPHFTGVLEKLDKENTVKMALELFPKTRDIFFIGDQSTTSYDLAGKFRNNYQHHFPGLNFHYFHKSDLSELTPMLEKLSEESLVMLLPYLNQRGNKLLDIGYATHKITQASTAPVFSFWHFMLNHGIIGGKLVRGQAQGENAAKLAVQILKGEAVGKLPVIEIVPNDNYFDYNVLEKFGVSQEQLPARSIIINPSTGFFENYKSIILGFLFSLLLFTFLFIIYMIHSRRIKKVLRSELSFQRTLINALPNPVFYTLDNQRIEDCNQAFEKLTGYAKEDITGKEIPAFYLPNQKEKHLSINQEIIQTLKPATYEGQVIGYENKIRDVIFYKSPIYNRRTRKYGIIETIVDITDKKNTTEHIRLSEERYALATRATQDGIWDWNIEKQELFVSDRLKEILGYSPHDNPFNHFNFQYSIHPADLNIFNHQMDLLRQQAKETMVLEMRMKKKEGSYVWVESKFFGIADKNNDIYRVVGSISDIQNRKDAEITLRRWEEIFRNTLLGITIGNPEKEQLELMNPVFAHMHGYTPEELYGKTLQDLHAPEAKYTPREILNTAVKQGHYVVESLHIRKDGTVFPVMIDITVVKNQREEVSYFIINLQDITQRKKQESKIAQMLQKEQIMNEELRSSEEEVRQSLQQTVNFKEKLEETQHQFLSFIDGTSDFAILKDKEFRYLIVNESFARFYHRTTEQIIGKTDEEIAPKSLAEDEKVIDERVISENKPTIYEREVDGRYYETHKFPVFYENNQIGLGAFIRDITKHRLIEQQVQKNEQRFRTLLENSFDLITLIDKDGNILYNTEAIGRMTGFSAHDFKDKHITMFLHPEDRILFNQKLERLLKLDTEPAYIHHRLKHAQEGFRNIETIATNHLKNPLINAIVLTSRDVSLEIQSRELKKNIALAQKSAEIKQQFLANMSHEIRTPMNGIVGMIEFLLRTPLNETQEDYVKTIKSSADSLLNIINDILDFSKIEAGKLSINPIPVNVRKFVSDAPKIFSALVRQKDLEFNLFIDESLPEYLNIDPMRINQIISNLLSNAIKFTPSGEVSLRVFPDKITHDEVSLRIEVQDTGIGISDEEQKKLFTPFSQIDSSITRTQEGTGLGLTICQRMVELMGGEIGVISKTGKGSMFWFTITTAISEHEKVRKFIDSFDDPHTKDLNINILLVEDKIVNQKVIQLMLQTMGCNTTIASNGKEAIDILEKYRINGATKEPAFQIILMDIQMPVMDGITATKIIRQKYTEYPVIIGLSANVFSTEVEGYLRSGLDDYIVKPAKSDDLYKKLIYWSEKGKTLVNPDIEQPLKIIERLKEEKVFEKNSLEIIKSQSSNNIVVLKELFSAFHNDAKELLQNIRKTSKTNDRKALDFIQTLNSMAQSMGAHQVSKTCEALAESISNPLAPHERMIGFLEKTLQAYMTEAKIITGNTHSR